MDSGFLSDENFKGVLDSIASHKFAPGSDVYSMDDIGDMVELTEMTLSDRIDVMSSEISKSFEDLNKSLDSIQKSMYDMFDMLVDSHIDAETAKTNGGLTDEDVQKIITGLQLEDKFFPSLYRYLDERFHLDESKVPTFKQRTSDFMLSNPAPGSTPELTQDAITSLSERDATAPRQTRTESTARINRELSQNEDPTKQGKAVFEDQALFQRNLKLWTEGHKEGAKQDEDKNSRDKKKNNDSDESWISKLIKIGMIGGLLIEVLSKSPALGQFFSETYSNIKDTFTSTIGPVLEDIPKQFYNLWENTLKPWLSEKWNIAKEWVKTNFPGLFSAVEMTGKYVEALYYTTMTDEEQEAYAESHPNSDLAIWIKGNGGGLDKVDIGQFVSAFSGESGDFLRQEYKNGRIDNVLSSDYTIEDYANSAKAGYTGKLNGIGNILRGKEHYRTASVANIMHAWGLGDMRDDYEYVPTALDESNGLIKLLQEYGATKEYSWSTGGYVYKNTGAAVKKFLSEYYKEDNTHVVDTVHTSSGGSYDFDKVTGETVQGSQKTPEENDVIPEEQPQQTQEPAPKPKPTVGPVVTSAPVKPQHTEPGSQYMTVVNFNTPTPFGTTNPFAFYNSSHK